MATEETILGLRITEDWRQGSGKFPAWKHKTDAESYDKLRKQETERNKASGAPYLNAFEKAVKCFVSLSKDDHSLPPELRLWSPYAALESALGRIPSCVSSSGSIQDQDSNQEQDSSQDPGEPPGSSVTLYRVVRPFTGSDKRFSSGVFYEVNYFPCIFIQLPEGLSGPCAELGLPEAIPVPLAYALPAIKIAKNENLAFLEGGKGKAHSISGGGIIGNNALDAFEGFSSQSKECEEMTSGEAEGGSPTLDWRLFRFEQSKRTNKIIRSLAGQKRMVKESDAFGSSFKVSAYHSLSPTEIALSVLLWEVLGIRLVIPPSYRENRLSYTDPRVDPHRYLFTGFDERIDKDVKESGWLHFWK